MNLRTNKQILHYMHKGPALEGVLENTEKISY